MDAATLQQKRTELRAEHAALEEALGITYCYEGHRVTWDSGLDVGDHVMCPTCYAKGQRYVELGKPKPVPVEIPEGDLPF